MLSYATYISATIHARIVAQKGRKSRSYQSLLFCRDVLDGHTRLYVAASKAKANLERLVSHLSIELEQDRQSSPRAASTVPSNSHVNRGVPVSHNNNYPEPETDLDSTPYNWDLTGLDLEAIAEGFRLDGELCYLMHPGGV